MLIVRLWRIHRSPTPELLKPKPLNLLLLRQIAAVDGNDRAGCVA